MARIFGLSGRLTGRKGDAVFSVRKGEQIVRQYNPMVLNPNTEAQIVQRSRMKLSSQLSAVFANVIAIPSEGAKTSRNIFTKINFNLIQRDSQQAGIVVTADLPAIQLTKSGRAMCPIAVSKPVANGPMAVSLLADCSQEFDRVVYTVMAIQADGSMRVVHSEAVNNAGFCGRFYHTFQDPMTNFVVYAYGIKDLSSKATSIFQDTVYNEGDAVASLISSRTVSAADAQVSKTVGVLYVVDEEELTKAYASNGGHAAHYTVSGGTGVTGVNNIFLLEDDTVVLNPTIAEGYHFNTGTITIGSISPITISAIPYTYVVEMGTYNFTGMISFTAAANE